MKLFHVTLKENFNAVWRDGIDPNLAQGKMLASWYCDEKRVLWALAHTSAKRAIPVCDLIVMEVTYKPSEFVRWSRDGIFYSKVKQPVVIPWGWEHFVAPED